MSTLRTRSVGAGGGGTAATSVSGPLSATGRSDSDRVPTAPAALIVSTSAGSSSSVAVLPTVAALSSCSSTIWSIASTRTLRSSVVLRLAGPSPSGSATERVWITST